MGKVVGICVIIFITIIIFGLSIFRIHKEYKNDRDNQNDEKFDNGYNEFIDDFII